MLIKAVEVLKSGNVNMFGKLMIESHNSLRDDYEVTGTHLDTLVEENNIYEKQIDELQMKVEPEKCETPAENVPAPITLIDIFNEMGRLYADLWNKMEDIHYDLKTKKKGGEK